MQAPQSFSHYPTWPVPLDLPGYELGEESCSYLPGQTTRIRGFACHDMPAAVYETLMQAGFRRSGILFYQPVCPGCRSCVPLRVPVRQFHPSKSQRRALRSNQDVRLLVRAPVPTQETFELYGRFMEARHPQSRQGADWETFVQFLYTSPVTTVEMRYTLPSGELLGVGICDVTPNALSSVYFYFEPALAYRSPGVFSQLREIEYAQQTGLEHVYLGYWVPGSAAMAYKAAFRPHEILRGDGVWESAGNVQRSN